MNNFKTILGFIRLEMLHLIALFRSVLSLRHLQEQLQYGGLVNYSTAAAILVAPSVANYSTDVVNYSTAAILAPSVGTSWNPVWGQTLGDLASVAAPILD